MLLHCDDFCHNKSFFQKKGIAIFLSTVCVVKNNIWQCWKRFFLVFVALKQGLQNMPRGPKPAHEATSSGRTYIWSIMKS